jgi:transcription elongation factor GreB
VSKAFGSEETPDLPSLGREPPALRPGEVRYVTPEGHAALREALEALRLALQQAAGLPEGERGARVAALERQVALVAGTLASVSVLGPDAAPPGVVAFARWVTVEDGEGRRVTWRLVGPDEADPRRGLVSVHSPVGRALLGRVRGDTVSVERPGGPREYVVLDVALHAGARDP